MIRGSGWHVAFFSASVYYNLKFQQLVVEHFIRFTVKKHTCFCAPKECSLYTAILGSASQ